MRDLWLKLKDFMVLYHHHRLVKNTMIWWTVCFPLCAGPKNSLLIAICVICEICGLKKVTQSNVHVNIKKLDRMIYTIGYQKMKDANELVQELKKYGIKLLMDVRSRPYGWNPSFNHNVLDDFLQANGIAYWWMGEQLGGYVEIKEIEIQRLAQYAAHENKTICLMCMEADPDRCHRKTEIARRLEAYCVEATHL